MRVPPSVLQAFDLARVYKRMRHRFRRLLLPSGPEKCGATRRRFLTTLPVIIALPDWGLPARLCAGLRPDRARPKTSNRLVYVVDDLKELTALYRACLELAGFEVRTFNDRAQALRAFLAANPRPALLITDYDGYPISAEQLMVESRQVQPDLKILMASGYPEFCLNFSGVRPDRFLPKPFGLDQLVTEVRALTRFASAPPTDFLQGL
jgi:CheY-like chemotaxis protein